jgi:cephalosporin hydroxylase
VSVGNGTQVASDLDMMVRLALRLGAVQKPNELRMLVQRVQELQPRVVLEVGTNLGGTLMCWCQLATADARIISVDLPGGEFGGGYPIERVPVFRGFLHGRQTLRLIRDDSHAPETLEKVQRELDGQTVDLLMIDGDHS